MNTEHPDFEPQVVFQIIHQIVRLSDKDEFKSSDLDFLIKQYQNEYTPHNEFMQVLCVTREPIHNHIIPLVCLDIDTVHTKELVQHIDIYVWPGQLPYTHLEEAFGAPQVGLQYFEDELSLLSDSSVSVWNLPSRKPVLLMTTKEVDNSACNVLRLVFQGFDGQPIETSYWKTIHDHGKFFGDSFMMSAMIDISGFVISHPKQNNVLQLAAEKKRLEEKKAQQCQEDERRRTVLQLIEQLLQRFIDSEVTHLHVYLLQEKTYVMLRQNRTTCFKQYIEQYLVSEFIARLKLRFKMDLNVRNQHIMDGSTTVERPDAEPVVLKAQVTPGEHGEYFIVYRAFEKYPVTTVTWDSLIEPNYLQAHQDKWPLKVTIDHLSVSQYQILSDWVYEQTEQGIMVLVTSQAQLPPLTAGHAYFHHWMQRYINRHVPDVLDRIKDIFHFDVQLDIRSLDKPLELIARKHWEEYFCAECGQYFVNYRQPKKEVSCPSCMKKGHPPIHNVNTFAFSYYLMGDKGRNSQQAIKPYWILDDGCDHRYYDKSPLREDAIPLESKPD